MPRRFRRHLGFANVTAFVALFVALSAGSYAAITLPKNSVGSKQLKANAVTSPKVKNGSLLASDFKAGQLPAGKQGPPGPQGAQGPAGAAGASGATKVTPLDSSTIVAAGADQSTSVSCDPGEKATGGGVFVLDAGCNTVLTTVPVTQSDSTVDSNDQATGWEGGINNTTGSDVQLVVEAICASP